MSAMPWSFARPRAQRCTIEVTSMRSVFGGPAVAYARASGGESRGSRPHVTSDPDHGSSTRATVTGNGPSSGAAPGAGSSVKKALATRTRLPHGVGNRKRTTSDPPEAPPRGISEGNAPSPPRDETTAMSIGATESLLASAGAISDPTAAQRPALQVWLRSQASGETQGVGREAHDKTDRAPTKMKPKPKRLS